MIKKIAAALKQVFIPDSEFEEEKIECAIDEEVVDCSEMDSPPYVGVPAPAFLEEDPWFAPPVLSEKQEVLRAELEAEGQLLAENESPKEVENIHELMYNIATSAGKTTVQLDPLGGSENFHSGPGGWMSGTGYGQFT